MIVRARRPASLLPAALALLGTACDEDPPEPTEEELAVAEATYRAQLELASEPSDPSLEACVERLERETPASVQDTIDVVGYAELLRDTCRTRLAEEARDPALCADIEARLVRNACRSRVAVAAHDPELCPSDARGRQPLCVALAAGNPGLCAAAPHLEREACRELLGDAEHGCAEAIAPELCQEIVARHRRRAGASDERTPSPARLVEPELVVTFAREGGEPVAEDVRLDTLDRGARVLDDLGRQVLELADPLGLSVVSHAERPSLVIRVPLPPPDGADDARLDARVAPLGASIEGFHPELGALHATEGEVHLTDLQRALGGRIEGRFSARCTSRAGGIALRGTFRTFVRDVAGPEEDPLGELEAAPEGEADGAPTREP
ncbi:MAG: hypothetical protein OHK0013_37680 [Sandaracinaceae bacterium]